MPLSRYVLELKKKSALERARHGYPPRDKIDLDNLDLSPNGIKANKWFRSHWPLPAEVIGVLEATRWRREAVTINVLECGIAVVTQANSEIPGALYGTSMKDPNKGRVR